MIELTDVGDPTSRASSIRFQALNEQARSFIACFQWTDGSEVGKRYGIDGIVVLNAPKDCTATVILLHSADSTKKHVQGPKTQYPAPYSDANKAHQRAASIEGRESQG
jgi:hypothetical protein